MEFFRLLDLYLCWILTSGTLAGGSTMNEKLQEYIFKDYNKHIRPSKKLGDVVQVDFFLTLLQLISVDEKSEEMTTSQYITLRWHDRRLRWDPHAFGGIEGIRVPSQVVWKPDLALSNNIDGHYDKTVPVNALLNYTGLVEWIPPAIYKSSCSIQVEYFPFDWQNCTLRFRSFTYSPNEIKLYSVYSKVVVDTEAYTDNGEWKVIHCPVKVNGDPKKDEYQDVTLYFIIQRKPLFYIINIIVPCILISSLSVLVFYLPSGCSEKTNMSISVLLGLPVYLLLLAKRVPETSLAVPLIGAYLLFTMLSVTFSVIFSVIVLNIYHRSPTTHEMKPWIRKVFIEFLPPLLHMDTNLTYRSTRDKSEPGIQPGTINQERLEVKNEEGQTERDGIDKEPRNHRSKPDHEGKDVERDKIPLKRRGKVLFADFLRSKIRKPSSGRRLGCNSGRKLPTPVRDDINDSGIYSHRATDYFVNHGIDTLTPQPKDPETMPSTTDHVCFSALRRGKALRTRKPVYLAKSPSELQHMLSEGQKQTPSEKKPANSEDDHLANSMASPITDGHEEYFRLTCSGRKNGSKNRKNQYSQNDPLVDAVADAYFNIEARCSEDGVPRPETKHNPAVVNEAPRNPDASSTNECTELFPTNADKPAAVPATFGDASRTARAPSQRNFAEIKAIQHGTEVRNRRRKKPVEPPFRYVIHALPETTNECLQAVDFVSQHVRNDNVHREKAREWQIVAMVLDQLMFWTFLLLYVTGSLYFAIQALTNFPPDHPFHAGEPKYASCWDEHEHLVNRGRTFITH